MEKLEKYRKIYNEDFSGWDFGWFDRYGTLKEAPLSWNYYNLIKKRVNESNSLLDMGTGGGEFLSIVENLPAATYATEGYEPNLPIAKKRLEPLGIEVKKIEGDIIPFGANSFDTILNRHESFKVEELKRTMKEDALFITQQIGGDNDIEINDFLGAEYNVYKSWCLDKAKEDLEEVGLKILDEGEDRVVARFYSIDAIIYYLRAIPWQIEGFSIEKYYGKLVELDEFIEERGYFDVTCHRFYLIAKKEK